MTTTVLLETDGLTLRPWTDADAAQLHAVAADPELRRRTSLDITSEQDALRWIAATRQAWADGERFAFAVLVDERVSGHIVLKRPGSATAEVGYWTAAHARGRGLAPRAVRALTRWAFAGREGRRPGRIELLHQADNTGSCRVAQKAGYRLESVLPASPPHYPNDGHLHVCHAPGTPDGRPAASTGERG
ncbi:GNAT family N-acetyltransferase [Kitasatospora nipponensis]